MKFREWLKMKKEKREERRRQKLALKREAGSPELFGLDGSEASEIDPPESRFTEEYGEFLNEQELRKEREAAQEREARDTEGRISREEE